jgi:sugar phosphate isomerase/epimerase
MKLGCCTWNFTHPHYEAPYDDAVRTIGELGFDGVEMIVFTQQDLDDYYTPAKIRELRELIASYDMEVSELVIYAYCADGLESTDPVRRERALATFARAAGVAREIGSPIINIVSHWVEGLQAPIAYPPSYIHPVVPGVDRIDATLRMTLPDAVDWPLVWSSYVESMRACTEIAEANDLTFTIEGHAHVIVSGTDAMLRLFDAVPSPSIGVNLDTAWHLIQREYLPISIGKLGDRIRHVHVRDGDGNTNYNLPVGRGITDWHDVVTALQGVGYDGFLSLEMGQYAQPERYAAESRRTLERVLSEVGVHRVRS